MIAKQIRYLRVSLATACNFNCFYCKPKGAQTDKALLADFDGMTETFRAVFVSLGNEESATILYPNPSNGRRLTVSTNLGSKSKYYSLSIYDISGNVVSKFQLSPGDSEILLTPKLKKGTYFAKIQNYSQVITKKFIVNE